jgi:uncharacterized protein (TIGR02284 family)
MQPHTLSPATLANIQELIESNYAGRDELYAAVETLDDDARKNVCRRLAEHLGGHAAELEQILLSNGDERFDPTSVEFIDHLSERMFLKIVKDQQGEANVLKAIEQCERNLKEKYDQMLRSTPESEAVGILERQRDEVEFGEQILHTMHDPPDEKPSDGASLDGTASPES